MNRRRFVQMLGAGAAGAAFGVPAVKPAAAAPVEVPEPDVIRSPGGGCSGWVPWSTQDRDALASGGLCAPMSVMYDFESHGSPVQDAFPAVHADRWNGTTYIPAKRSRPIRVRPLQAKRRV